MKPQGRICTNCRKRKPLSAFHRGKGRTDGRHSQCAKCRQAYYRAHYRALTPRQRKIRTERSKLSMQRHRAALQASEA